jgi:hypothetical protein
MAGKQTGKQRGAHKAPRSAFRGKTKPGKAKPANAKPANAKPAKAASAKPAKAASARPAKAASARLAKIQAVSGAVEQLGEITVPSGRLALFDVGLIGYLPRPALEPALVTTSAPADRPLAVIGRRVGRGRFADCWDHVAVQIADGEITHAKKLGEAGVDFARLVCMDFGALDHWQHEDSLDGLADFVFWGRDAAILAKVMGAPRAKEGHGWRNLPVADAEAKADQAERHKAANHWLLATDLRPHSHHFRALAAARKSPQGAGTIDVGGAKVCLFFTSWGDGVFPIYADLDHDERPVQIRVQLNTDASMAAMRAVNS